VTQESDTQVPKVVSARVNELAPLVSKWIKQNPGVPTSRLVQRGLRLALRGIAGKRHSHLVETEAN
jgi:hypothetical protein